MARPNTNYDNKRLELVKVAFDLFMRKGYENTTINDILKTSGISKGAMYHYFESKEEILDAVLWYIIEIDAERLEPIAQDGSLGAFEKLITLMQKMGTEVPEEVERANEYSKQRPSSILDYRARELSCERSVPVITGIIKEGIASGEFHTEYPEEIAEMFYAISQSMGFWLERNFSTEKLYREIDAFCFFLGESLQIEKAKTDMLRSMIQKQVEDYVME